MNSCEDDAALEPVMNLFRHSFEAERLAHAYLVVGDPAGSGERFYHQAASLLLCDEKGAAAPCGKCSNCVRVQRGTHPDVVMIEPEKKSRVIAVDAVRALNHRIQTSSFAGGWKVAVIKYADRLNDQAANAFLKTLEEPPARTLLLLLTDAPQSLLPTVVSRCQQLTVHEPERKRPERWSEALDVILKMPGLNDPLMQTVIARNLDALLGEEKKQIEKVEKAANKESDEKEDVINARIEARSKTVRAAILHAFILWQRDVLLLVSGGREDLVYHLDCLPELRKAAEGLDITQALIRVREAQQMVDKLEAISKPVVPVVETCLARMG